MKINYSAYMHYIRQGHVYNTLIDTKLHTVGACFRYALQPISVYCTYCQLLAVLKSKLYFGDHNRTPYNITKIALIFV
ncbi:hypothetical protein E6C60_2028 [Paenibacillus algicola]|uniref:Uncharacterized protein n=1 Tax=Paenibacillus algicola TaxID=2565926 RepID=A0A4P8XK94_9BACL|nr:hypothetical protein E6C60_2028 [Paenibacillus algicola]